MLSNVYKTAKKKVLLSNGDPGTGSIKLDIHMLKFSDDSGSLKRLVLPVALADIFYIVYIVFLPYCNTHYIHIKME
jgi:hypothetical protein